MLAIITRLVAFVTIAASLLIVAFLIANEIGGGFISPSHLYGHAFRPNSQPLDDAYCYEFGQVQIVHDLRSSMPVRRAVVRLNPGGRVVVFDRAHGWNLDAVQAGIDADYPLVPAEARRAWGDAMRRQLEIARDRGVSAAAEAVDTDDDSFLLFFGFRGSKGEELYPVTEGALTDSTLIVRGPGMAVYGNRIGLVLILWVVLTAAIGFAGWTLWKRVQHRRLRTEIRPLLDESGGTA